MIWYVITVAVDFLVDIVAVRWTSADKDLEILLLRQQLRVLERQLDKQARPSRCEKCFLAVLLVQLKQITGRTRAQLGKILIFTPQTLLKWHHELVRRKWTFQHTGRVGRPPIPQEVRQWIIRLAKENTDWGYDQIAGELLKLGYSLDPCGGQLTYPARFWQGNRYNQVLSWLIDASVPASDNKFAVITVQN